MEHSSREHVFSLSEKKREDKVLCKRCDEYWDEGVMIYSCRKSRWFNLHESCANLVQESPNHPLILHPHPLALYHFYCYACAKGFTFRCDKCDVNLDVKCAFIRPAAIQERYFSHHHHPLLLFENMPDDRIHCIVCGKYCSDPMIYGCLPCGFFLHLSCFNLQEEIFHPFHSYHNLTLKPLEDNDVACNACRENFFWEKFAYVCECKKCSFCLDVECASVIKPAITYDGHDHHLQFIDNIRKNNRVYQVNCSDCKLNICESYSFSCLYCDFNLHHTCGPLPYSIQHKSHIHPLIHTTCPIEDEKNCVEGEFYCDACEDQRDKSLPIYYCKECHFVAEISCAIPEVLSLLKGEHDGDVQLRNRSGKFGNLIHKKQELVIKPALTLYDIFNYLSEADREELNCALRKASGILGAKQGETITSKDWECIEIIFERDEAYTRFMKFVDIGIEIPIEFRDTEEDVQISVFKFSYKLRPKEEVVNIGDYKITRRLADILKDLLSKCGDVIAPPELSPIVKLYFVHMLCECMYNMNNTNVVEITKKTSSRLVDKLGNLKMRGI